MNFIDRFNRQRFAKMPLRSAMSILLTTAMIFSLSACSAISSIPDKVSDAAGTVADGAKDAVGNISEGVAGLFETINPPKDSTEFEDILNGITAQNIGAFVSELKTNVDFDTMLAKLDTENSLLADQISSEEIKMSKISAEFEKARAFISDPSHIKGNAESKSGEIAENLDVFARNASRIAAGLEPDAEIDTINRNAPEDYMVGRRAVQSKFYSTPLGSLNACVVHSNVYSDFVKNNGCYVISKDQYAIIRQIMESDKAGTLADLNIEYNGEKLTPTALENIKNDIQELERQSGKPYTNNLKPSEFTYNEAQTSAADQTLNNLQKKYTDESNAIKKALRQEAGNSKNSIISDCVKSDFLKVGQGTIIGGGIASVISVGFSIYEKTSAGKSIESFTEEDWKDVGIETLTGGSKGAVVGAGTGGLLCIFNIPVPIAAAIVATVFQTLVLYVEYQNGEISLDDLLSKTLNSGITNSVIGAGGIIGQMVIPVPIVGIIVGSVATAILIEVVKKYIPIHMIGEKAQEFSDAFSEHFSELLDNTSDTFSGAADTTKTTLTSAYSQTKSSIIGAVSFAADKVNALK